MEPQVSKVLKIQRLRTRGENIMTNKINMVINLSILALLIYLSVAVKEIQDEVFPDPNIMIPMSSKISDDQFQALIKQFLIQKLNQGE